MKTVLDTSDRPAHDALVEKKSEFIADVCMWMRWTRRCCSSIPFASCTPRPGMWAYAAICVDGDGRVRERMSDDGEPSGTAGKPILDVLRQGDLMNCAVTVTRYFGGILLGSGGLIRAYSSAASLGVKVARLASIETCRRYTTALQYPQFDVFRQLASDCGAALENERYSDRVVLDAVVPVEREREFLRRVRETFSATVTPESGELISRPVAI